MLGLSAQGETAKHFVRSTGLGEILSNLKLSFCPCPGDFSSNRMVSSNDWSDDINKRQPSTPPLVTRGAGTICSGWWAGPLALGTRASTPPTPKGMTERKTHRPVPARLITALTGRPLSESSLYSECRPQVMSHPSSWPRSAAERGVLTRPRWLVPKSHPKGRM